MHNGLICIILTSFHMEVFDLLRLPRLVDFYVSLDCFAIFANFLSSEMFYLSNLE